MSKMVAWIGLFFFALSSFLPIISVDIPFLKVSILSPVSLLSEMILNGDSFINSFSRISPNIPYLAIVTVSLFFFSMFLGFYSLVNNYRQGTFYAGVLGMLYVFLAFVTAYGLLRLNNTYGFMTSAGIGLYTAFFGSTLMIYASTQKRRKRRR